MMASAPEYVVCVYQDMGKEHRMVCSLAHAEYLKKYSKGIIIRTAKKGEKV